MRIELEGGHEVSHLTRFRHYVSPTLRIFGITYLKASEESGLKANDGIVIASVLKRQSRSVFYLPERPFCKIPLRLKRSSLMAPKEPPSGRL